MPEHLDEPHDRHDVGVDQGLDTGFPHAVPAHAEQAGARGERVQLGRQRRAVQVAGRLAGDDHDCITSFWQGTFLV